MRKESVRCRVGTLAVEEYSGRRGPIFVHGHLDHVELLGGDGEVRAVLLVQAWLGSHGFIRDGGKWSIRFSGQSSRSQSRAVKLPTLEDTVAACNK